MNELKMEWILLRRKKNIFIFALLPLIVCLLTFIIEYLYDWKMNNELYIYHFSTFYFIPITIIGALWICDELKYGLFLQLAVFQNDYWRYYVGKIVSLMIFLFFVLICYTIVFMIGSFALQKVVITKSVFSSFFVYYFTFIFLGCTGLIFAIIFRSAIVASTVIALYLILEKLLLIHFIKYPYFSFVYKLLPWSNFQSLIYQVTKHDATFISLIAFYKSDVLQAIQQPIYHSIIILFIYFLFFLIIGWRFYKKALK